MSFKQSYLYRLLRSPDIFSELLSQKVPVKKTLVLDFSSPNIAKQFHVGNLRSTIIGNFLQNIYRRAGHKVISINYLGDWGTQMAYLALQWPESCRQFGLDSTKFREMKNSDKIRLLTRTYIEAHRIAKTNPDFHRRVLELFASMEKAWTLGETPTSNDQLVLWMEFRNISTDYLREFYEKFAVNFDVWEGESDYILDAHRLIDRLISEGKAIQKPEADELDGRWLAVNPEDGASYVLKKSDNTSIYLSREYGAIMSRQKRYNADQYLYIVDTAQSVHFKALKFLLRLSGHEEYAEKIVHVEYGRIAGLSTRYSSSRNRLLFREGNSEAVDNLIEQGSKLATEFLKGSVTLRVPPEELPNTAYQLAITAIVMNGMYNLFMMSFKNKHTRLNSLAEAHTELCQKLYSGDVGLETMHIEQSPVATQLFDRLFSLDEVLMASYQAQEPCEFSRYLMSLARETGQAFKELRIKGQPEEIALPRMLLFLATKRVLADGMKLMGITPLLKM